MNNKIITRMGMKETNSDIQELFVCSCNNIEHQLVFSTVDVDENPMVYVTVHLNPRRNVFKRVWHAVRYIFGYRCTYGDFDEFIFKPEDAERLQEVVEVLKKGEAKLLQ